MKHCITVSKAAIEAVERLDSGGGENWGSCDFTKRS